MGDKDTFVFQRERIQRIFIDQFPDLDIEFKPAGDKKISEFRFRIVEKSGRRIRASIPEHRKWAVTEVADWTDDKIVRKMREILNKAFQNGTSM